VTGTRRCADVRLSLGVYVLGAAEPAERALVRVHLARCHECREQVAGLAGLPGLLRRVPADEAEKIFTDEGDPAGHPDELAGSALPGLLDRTARTRRIRRFLALTAAAAAIVIAVGGGVAARGGFGLGGHRGNPIAWETFSARNDVTLARATVRYVPTQWGAHLEVRVSGVAPGTVCELRVTGAGGRREIAGGWTVVSGENRTWIEGATSFPASSLRSFAVVAGRRTLVTVPATGS
jgi:Putative zinc-finger